MNNENNQSNSQNVNNNVNPNSVPVDDMPTSVVEQDSIPQPTTSVPMQSSPLQDVQNQVPINGENDSVTNNQPGSDYVPPSNFKIFLLFLLFVILIGFVVFLPDITEMINKYQSSQLQQPIMKIENGKLTCTLDKNTENLDLDYTAIFTYSNNKLEKLSFSTITKGDISMDSNQLDELAKKCSLLEKSVEDIDEVTIRCNYTDGELEEKQSFSLETLDYKKLDSAFSEVGGTIPNYQFGDSIDSIEKEMNASGYTCKRSAE